MSDQCECGGTLIPATKQIMSGGPRYPLRDRDTGQQLLACGTCGMVRSTKAPNDNDIHPVSVARSPELPSRAEGERKTMNWLLLVVIVPGCIIAGAIAVAVFSTIFFGDITKGWWR